MGPNLLNYWLSEASCGSYFCRPAVQDIGVGAHGGEYSGRRSCNVLVLTCSVQSLQSVPDEQHRAVPPFAPPPPALLAQSR